MVNLALISVHFPPRDMRNKSTRAARAAAFILLFKLVHVTEEHFSLSTSRRPVNSIDSNQLYFEQVFSFSSFHLSLSHFAVAFVNFIIISSRENSTSFPRPLRPMILFVTIDKQRMYLSFFVLSDLHALCKMYALI